ncbi:hypothetical protein DFH08DRAFT_897968 [Mycena albidolilacea]|uniref:Uncharacterized protein n=1 Tax=Mycena albidolilacea TaxID=1033008 RepID=A0AAD6Z8K6_9AGAR|nr:hypothetical protein DFH08DRAFT_897968 [Mycena albidolilacea]
MARLGGPQCTRRYISSTCPCRFLPGPLCWRLWCSDITVLPGHKYNRVTFALDPDPEYVQGDSFQADLAEYARKHEGLLHLWSLVGNLDADGLRGAEKPGDSGRYSSTRDMNCYVCLKIRSIFVGYGKRCGWRCCLAQRKGRMGSDEPEWLVSFKDAARKIAGDERAPMVWHARFACVRFFRRDGCTDCGGSLCWKSLRRKR